MKSLGVPSDYSLLRFKAGSGDAIIATLDVLADRALALGQFKRGVPVHKTDE